MPAVASKTTIAAAVTTTQALDVFEAIHTALLAAGFSRILNFADTGNARGRLYRFPPLDNGDSRPDFLRLMANQTATSGTNVQVDTLYDHNIQATLGTSAAALKATGTWTGSWPASGSPTLAAFGSNSQFASGTFDSLSSFTLKVIASEYGFMAGLHTGGTSEILGIDRGLDAFRSKREMAVVGAASLDYPLTFAAPSGGIAAHLRFNIEGVVKDVTFPTGVPLGTFRLNQELTRQLGIAESYTRTRATMRDEIVVRIQPDRGPIGNVSTTRPQISLVYQDPSVKTAGLTFEIGAGVWTVGANQISRANYNFVATRVRIGATVRNHTRNLSTTVTGFATTGTRDDTALLVSTATWVQGDVIEVYPGPEDHSHAVGKHGGLWQGVLQGAETSNITAGANRILVLNDRYGEAQNQYEVGQSVFLANNGFGQVLNLSSVVGTFRRHEAVEVTAGTGLGARGLIRGIAGAVLAVDTIRGATALNVVPWVAAATITGLTSGATATISSVTANTNTGWYQNPLVVAIGQVDPANGDYRTTLTLNLVTGVNASAVFGPCAVVGIRAKCYLMTGTIFPSTGTFRQTPYTESAAPTSGASKFDVNRHEVTVLASEPHRAPDYETHSVQLCEHNLPWSQATTTGNDYGGPLAHFRSVNARNFLLGFGDELREDGDPQRVWTPVNYVVGAMGGAHSNVAGSVWGCIGPGAIP